MNWKKATIVGVGLLGGSLGMALKERRLAAHVTGYVRRRQSIAECKRAGAVDDATCDLAEAGADADLVVFCTPLSQMPDLLARMAPHLRPGTLLTDVGSVKRSVVDLLEPIAAKASLVFVGSHPMAGSEKTGVSASKPDLFEDAVSIVTPTRKTPQDAVEKIEVLWKNVGSRVLRMSPATHDLLVSRSSHLPHVTAAHLANFVLQPPRAAAIGEVCATGFRDSTRLAAGSPEMWRDIMLANSDYIADAIEQLGEKLKTFAGVVRRRDEKRITKFLEQAKQRRDEWASRPRSKSPE